MKNTTEGNKLIAEFMGASFKSYKKGQKTITNLYFDNPPSYNGISDENLKYHSSWDWLMPVVEKIEHTLAYVNIKGCAVNVSTFIETSAPTKIEAVWLAVCECIKLINKTKSDETN